MISLVKFMENVTSIVRIFDHLVFSSLRSRDQQQTCTLIIPSVHRKNTAPKRERFLSSFLSQVCSYKPRQHMEISQKYSVFFPFLSDICISKHVHVCHRRKHFFFFSHTLSRVTSFAKELTRYLFRVFELFSVNSRSQQQKQYQCAYRRILELLSSKMFFSNSIQKWHIRAYKKRC